MSTLVQLHKPIVDSVWYTKSRAYDLFTEIDKYAQAYLSEHQDILHSSNPTMWHNQWYHLYQDNDLGNKNQAFSHAALAITNRQHATLIECLSTILGLIPELHSHCIIHNVSQTNGNCLITFYSYGTAPPMKYPEKTATLPPAPTRTSASLAVIEDNETDENNAKNDGTKPRIGTNLNPILETEQDTDSQQTESTSSSSNFFFRFTPNNKSIQALKTFTTQVRDKADDIISDPNIRSYFSPKSVQSSTQKPKSSFVVQNPYKKQQTPAAPSKPPTVPATQISIPSLKYQSALEALLANHDWDEIMDGPRQMLDSYNKYRSKLTSKYDIILDNFRDECNQVKKENLEDFMVHCAKQLAEQELIFHKILNSLNNKHKQEMELLSKEYKDELTSFQLSMKSEMDNFKADTLAIFKNQANSYAAAATFKPVNPPSSTPSNQTSTFPPPSQSSPHRPTLSTTTRDGHTTIHVTTGDQLQFQYEGITLELQDKSYIKMTPKILPPRSHDDGLTLYSMMQKNALIYNIILTPIQDITKWTLDTSPNPPTCGLPYDTTETFKQAYQRMSTAIYNVLSKINFSKVTLFKTFLEHQEAANQDGFRVLYSILAQCHPRLMQRTKMQTPTIDKDGFFRFITRYENYLEFELINNRVYTDLEKVTYVREKMQEDGRFEKAINSLEIKLTWYHSIKNTDPSAPFPRELALGELPNTILHMFNQEEREDLFGYSYSEKDENYRPTHNNQASIHQAYTTTDELYQPSILKMTPRPRVNKKCPCCGVFGHHVNENGCDFAAAHIKTTSYLKKYPDSVAKITDFQRKHQDARKANMDEPTLPSVKSKFKKFAKDKNVRFKPAVKLLVEALDSTLADIFTSDQPYSASDTDDSDLDEDFSDTYETEE